MSEQIIICATTASKSKKSRQQVIAPVMELFRRKIFGTCELLVGPANHPERTPEKHQMALSQATYAAQVGIKVSLIFVIPKDYNTSDMSEIQSLSQSKGINMKVLNLLEVLDGRLLET